MSNINSYSPVNLPILDDDLRFPSSTTQSAITNMAALQAIDLDLVRTDEGYSGNVGADGTPMVVSADLVKVFGSGEFHYKDGDLTTDLIIIDAANASTVISLDGTTLTEIIVLRGKVTIQSSAGAITRLQVHYHGNRATDANVTIESGAGTITDLLQTGGIVRCNAAVTNARIDGGTLIQDIATITTLEINSGLVDYDFGGIIATARVRGGELNLMRNDDAKTITTLFQFPQGFVRHDPDIHTFTTHHDMRERK